MPSTWTRPWGASSGRCVQCSKTVAVYTECVEYPLHGESTLRAGEQRPAPGLDAPIRVIPALARCTDLLVLEISGNRSDDCLGRAAGVDLVAFPVAPTPTAAAW